MSTSSRSLKPRPRVAGAGARIPCVLAIGGLDPGAGAGILADARAVAHAGAFACAAVAVLTVQSTSGLRTATPVATRELVAECKEVLVEQHVRAIKTGALGSEDNVKAVGDLLAAHRSIPSVVDTVMLPTRGRTRLLEERGVSVLRDRLLRRATVVTANAPEAEVLAGMRIRSLDDARDAALALLALGPRAVLVKGGHLSGAQAVDVLALWDADRTRVHELATPRLRIGPVHGGGCALASLVAGRLARGSSIPGAVRWAKATHHAALRAAANVGGEMRVLFARSHVRTTPL